jgi:bacteriorhodopsin
LANPGHPQLQKKDLHMKNTKIFVSQFVTAVAIFGAGYMVLHQFTDAETLDITVKGWGWAVLVACVGGLYLSGKFVGSFFSGLLSGTRFEPGKKTTAYIEKFYSWFIAGPALLFTAAIVPSQVKGTSVFDLCALGIIMGLAAATSDLVSDWLVDNE